MPLIFNYVAYFRAYAIFSLLVFGFLFFSAIIYTMNGRMQRQKG